jgi:hypothetical protein
MRPLSNELAEALRAELAGWPGVAVRGMMGTLSFFRDKQMLGCYVSRDLLKKPVKPEWVNRPGEPPFVWVRLRLDDKLRALHRPGVRAEGAQRVPDDEQRRPRSETGAQHKPQREAISASRLGFAGWIEIPLESRASLEEAVRWFGRAFQRPPRSQLAKHKPGTRHRGRKKSKSK